MATLPTPADAVTVLSRSLAATPAIDLCLLYGSFARGTATPQSDVDVLVVTESPVASAWFGDRLRLECPAMAEVASITSLRAGDLALEQRTRPSFVAHLRDEGQLLGWSSGGKSTSALCTLRSAIGPNAIDAEVECRLDRAVRSLRPQRLNGRFASALGRLYSASKAVCIARLLERGEPQYDWRLVFDAFGETWPTLREEVTLLANLRPFYEELRGTGDGRLVPASRHAQLLDDSLRSLKDIVVASRE